MPFAPQTRRPQLAASWSAFIGQKVCSARLAGHTAQQDKDADQPRDSYMHSDGLPQEAFFPGCRSVRKQSTSTFAVANHGPSKVCCPCTLLCSQVGWECWRIWATRMSKHFPFP
jgi:hypothetical protein